MPIHIRKEDLAHEELSVRRCKTHREYMQYVSRKAKLMYYVDHGVSTEISYDRSIPQIRIGSSDIWIDLVGFGYTPSQSPKREYIYGRYLEAVTDYKTMTIISKNKEGNLAKSGSKTYTYNKNNWNNWKQTTQQEQS
tara:strand:+ start:1103 stop:1513 length:411 start_codon:yes stop_codon:yes gene_type:complete